MQGSVWRKQLGADIYVYEPPPTAATSNKPFMFALKCI